MASGFGSFLKKYQLVLFFVLTIGIMSAMMVVVHFTGNDNFGLVAVVLIGPSVTAIVLTAALNGKSGLRDLFAKQMSWRVGIHWYAIALFGIALLALIASLLANPGARFVRPSLFPQIIFLFLISFGEEFGFRGYALPRLQKRFSALTSGIVLGLLWGLWHFPGFLVGTGVPLDMPFYMFMLWVIPGTILMTWIYNNTKNSVLIAGILVHTGANAAFSWLPLLPEITGELRTFWLFLGLIWAVTIVIVLVFGPKHLSRSSRIAS